tara:strand:- start:746 stop:1195 length:450 start_codon:yes stop_codon:yes gene_type:complete
MFVSLWYPKQRFWVYGQANQTITSGEKMWMFRRKKDENEGRRNHERCKTKLPFRFQHGDKIIIGTTEELSLTGAWATNRDTGCQHNPAQPITKVKGEFSLILPEGEIRVPSVITRSNEAGLAFKLETKKAQEAHAQLIAYLETQLGNVW